MFKQFFANRLRTSFAIALSVAAFTSLAAGASATSGSSAAVTSPAAAESATGQPNSIEAALASGKLDREVLNELRDKGAVDVILSFKSQDVLEQATADAPTGKDRAKAIIEQSELGFAKKKHRTLDPLGGDARVLREFDALPASFVRVDTEKALLELVQSEDVHRVGANERGTTALAQSLPLIRQPTAASSGYKGDGYVAVLDTGVDYTHAAFGSCTGPNNPTTCKVRTSWDAAPNDYSRDDNGHGTNVSGIVAGVASGTRILAVDVFDKNAAGDSYYANEWVLAGINWVINQKKAGYPVRAMNMSLGVRNSHYTSTCTSNYTSVFNTARQVGILPVLSAGNSANNGSGYTDGISYPACTAGAVRVGAVYDANVGSRSWASGCTDSTTAADKITCFSQGGPNLTMLAPGGTITAAGWTQSGTSQAAPHVAGAVAVLAAAKPSATVDQIQSALANSGRTISDSRSGVARTFHRLDLPAALDKLLGVAPKVTTPIQRIASVSSAKISWTGTDELSGIKSYELWKSTDGGTWSKVTLASATSTSATVAVEAGRSYKFAVRAHDNGGNASAWSYGLQFTVRTYDSAGSSITFAGSWSTASGSSYFGGSTKYTYTAGRTATLPFNGRNVAWIGTRSSNAGTTKVFVDDVYTASVSQQSTTTINRSVLYQKSWSSAGAHKVKVEAAGTGGYTDVDAIVVYQ